MAPTAVSTICSDSACSLAYMDDLMRNVTAAITSINQEMHTGDIIQIIVLALAVPATIWALCQLLETCIKIFAGRVSSCPCCKGNAVSSVGGQQTSKYKGHKLAMDQDPEKAESDVVLSIQHENSPDDGGSANMSDREEDELRRGTIDKATKSMHIQRRRIDSDATLCNDLPSEEEDCIEDSSRSRTGTAPLPVEEGSAATPVKKSSDKSPDGDPSSSIPGSACRT